MTGLFCGICSNGGGGGNSFPKSKLGGTGNNPPKSNGGGGGNRPSKEGSVGSGGSIKLFNDGSGGNVGKL
jgi:hypothetical protein